MNPIQAARLYFKLRPLIKKEQTLMRMKLSTSTLTQILLGAGQIGNLIAPFLSGNAKIITGGILAALTVVVNTISHLSTPAGGDVNNGAGTVSKAS